MQMNLLNRRLESYFLLFIVAVLSACSHLPLQESNQIKKPVDDDREYQYLVLDNGLKVLLVSDKAALQAAASMNVSVGSGDDPIERQGLAHFLEHMLFLGTKKYPEAGGYQKFIASNGGNNNAYTAYEDTNYFFDVDDAHIEEALDRFAQFFIAPTFDEKFSGREKNAVQSEFELKIDDDGRRIIDAVKSIVNPAHPFSKFSTGNLTTLADREGKSLKDELQSFYNKYYFAENMNLAFYSNLSIEEMAAMVKKQFSPIAQKPRVKLSVDDSPHITQEPLFLAGTLPSKLYIQSVKDVKVLSLLFPVKDDRKNYQTNSLYFLAHLLGYEGKGSLLSELKRLGWAESLRSGGGLRFNDGVLFPIDISLTSQGYQHIDDIIGLFFQTIKRIEKEGVNKSFYAEQQRISRMMFEFKENERPINFVGELARNLRYYQSEDVVYGPYMMERFDKALLTSMLASFNPSNMLVQIVSQNEEAEAKTSWYQTPYAIESISDKTVKKWNALDLHENILIPQKNKYVVENFELNKELNVGSQGSDTIVDNYPVSISKTSNLEVWKVPVNEFKQPKSNIYIRFNSLAASSNIKNTILNDMYATMLSDTLNEELYDAYLSGLGLSFDSHLRGVSLQVSGFNEKQIALLSTALGQIKLSKIDASRFDSLKKEYKLSLENQTLNKSYIRTYALFQSMMQKPFFRDDEKLKVLDQISSKDLEKFIPEFWGNVNAQVLVNGNLTNTQALKVGSLVSKQLPSKGASKKISKQSIGLVKLPNAKDSKRLWHINTAQSDAAYLRYIQADTQTLQDQVSFMMAGQILDPLFYYQMRTEQQLGYLVSGGYFNNLAVPGLSFLIQSNRFPAEILDKAVSLFLADAAAYIETKLTQEDFDKNKAAVMAKLLLPPNSLDEQSASYWSAIALDQPFELKQQLADALAKLSFNQWKVFYAKTIGDGNVNKTIRFVTQQALKPTEIDAQQQWKLQQEVFWLQ